MNKLDVIENKRLVLKQVIIKKHKNVNVESFDEKLSNFINQLQIFKVQTFGPLITRNAGTTVHEDGKMTTDFEFVVQAHDYKQYEKKFSIKENMEFSNCVFLKFKGNPNDLHYAHSKLDLYFYENGLIPNGDIINVILKESTEWIEVDLFRPVTKL